MLIICFVLFLGHIEITCSLTVYQTIVKDQIYLNTLHKRSNIFILTRKKYKSKMQKGILHWGERILMGKTNYIE